LHYAVVALGTPNVTFLVALDTGSDLFWVPCDCVKCAPLTSPTYGVRLLLPLLHWSILLRLELSSCCTGGYRWDNEAPLIKKKKKKKRNSYQFFFFS
jgi:hypothetical protein